MVENQAERRGISCATRLLAIHFVKHPVGKEAVSLQYKVPIGQVPNKRCSKYSVQHEQRNYGVYKSNQGQSIWRNCFRDKSHQIVGAGIPKDNLENAFVDATVLVLL